MPNKYLSQNSGNIQEVEAVDASAGGADAGKIAALDGSGKLAQSMMPTGVGPDSQSIEASETLAAGDLVNIHDSTGVKIRKADASNGREAHGFVLSAVTSGQQGEVYFDGTISGLTGLTPGNTYFLSSSSAGLTSATAPSTTGQTVQKVGRAISTTALTFEPGETITLA